MTAETAHESSIHATSRCGSLRWRRARRWSPRHWRFCRSRHCVGARAGRSRVAAARSEANEIAEQLSEAEDEYQVLGERIAELQRSIEASQERITALSEIVKVARSMRTRTRPTPSSRSSFPPMTRSTQRDGIVCSMKRMSAITRTCASSRRSNQICTVSTRKSKKRVLHEKACRDELAASQQELTDRLAAVSRERDASRLASSGRRPTRPSRRNSLSYKP